MCLRKTGQYSSLSDCARQVFREGGLRSFYRGYLPNTIGIVPYAGAELALYEKFKSLYQEHASDYNPPPYLAPIFAVSASSAVSFSHSR